MERFFFFFLKQIADSTVFRMGKDSHVEFEAWVEAIRETNTVNCQAILGLCVRQFPVTHGW